MIRPCFRKHLLPQETASYCEFCRLQLQFQLFTTEPGKPLQTQPCQHLGDSPLAPQRQLTLGLGTLRQYYPCAKGHGPHGYVCQCKNYCGPNCADYLPTNTSPKD